VTLYLLRTVLAPSQTLRGVRRMVLDAAPVPGVIEVPAIEAEASPEQAPELHPGVFFASHGGTVPHLTRGPAGQLEVCNACPTDDAGPDPEPVAEFATKKAAFLSRYRGHPEYGAREAAGRVASELAPLAGLQAGTGRTYIAEELKRLAALAIPLADPRAVSNREDAS
jgi:hypothetical protein